MNKMFKYNENEYHYEVKGKGPLVALIHGFMETSMIWDKLIPLLSDNFTVIAIDLPGHGKSKLKNINSVLTDSAIAIIEIAKNLGFNKFSICGHSLGGYVALEIARLSANYLNSIILFHSHAAPDSDSIKEQRDRTIDIIKLNKKNFIANFIPELLYKENRNNFAKEIETIVNHASAMSEETIITWLKAMKYREGYIDICLEATFPFFFIIGKNDSKLIYRDALAQSSICCHSEVLQLNEVGHLGFVEKPNIIFPAIVSFFKRSN